MKEDPLMQIFHFFGQQVEALLRAFFMGYLKPCGVYSSSSSSPEIWK
jgi:hypothetical protein